MTLIPNLLCTVRAVVRSWEGAPLPEACLQPGAGRTAVSSAMRPAPSVYKKKGRGEEEEEKLVSKYVGPYVSGNYYVCRNAELFVGIRLVFSSTFLAPATTRNACSEAGFRRPVPAAVRRLQLQLKLLHFLVRQLYGEGDAEVRGRAAAPGPAAQGGAETGPGPAPPAPPGGLGRAPRPLPARVTRKRKRRQRNRFRVRRAAGAGGKRRWERAGDGPGTRHARHPDSPR